MSPTVLIVDDSKLARIVAARALSALQPDWQRVEAGSAAEAHDIVAKQPIDVALIDFNMADKDGLEFATELRRDYPDLPIAIITANIQDEIIARARAINATFVTKPITKEGLEGFLSGAALRFRSKTS
jgi:CheY-like chemotaxis protein